MKPAVVLAALLLAGPPAAAAGAPGETVPGTGRRPAPHETIHLCALAPCPQVCPTGSPRVGVAVELVEAALHPARVEVHGIARPRCLKMVEDGLMDGAIAAEPGDDPGRRLLRVPLRGSGAAFLGPAEGRPSGGPGLAARLGAGLARLEAEGRTDGILARYGIAGAGAR